HQSGRRPCGCAGHSLQPAGGRAVMEGDGGVLRGNFRCDVTPPWPAASPLRLLRHRGDTPKEALPMGLGWRRIACRTTRRPRRASAVCPGMLQGHRGGEYVMAHNGFKVLDSDMHCMEPADLWERYIDDAYKPSAPRGLQEYIADLRIVINGKTMPRHSSLRPRYRHGEADPFAARRERFKAAAERGWDGVSQLEAMDTEGIDVAVVYPSRGLFAQALDDLDPAFAAAIARAYNNWLHDYC